MTPAEATARFIAGQPVWFWTPTRKRLIEIVLMRHHADDGRWDGDKLASDGSGRLIPGRWTGIHASDLHETRDDALRDEACRVLAGESVVGWRGLL